MIRGSGKKVIHHMLLDLACGVRRVLSMEKRLICIIGTAEEEANPRGYDLFLLLFSHSSGGYGGRIPLGLFLLYSTMGASFGP